MSTGVERLPACRILLSTSIRNKIANACYILAALLFSCKLFAQKELIVPPAKFISTVPFTQLTGGIIILHATLDDFKDTLNFVLGTGSGGISLNSLTCAYYHLTTVPSDKTVRGVAGAKKASFANDHTLHFKGITVDSLDFHINDYESLSSTYGIKIDGIMGLSFLRRYVVALDYDKMEMAVFEPGSYQYPEGGYLLKQNFSNIPKEIVEVNDNTDVRSQFYFDTGSGLFLLMTDDFIEDSAIFKNKRKLYAVNGLSFGGTVPMTLSVVKEIKLGPYSFRDVPVYKFKDQYGVISYPDVSGVLGNDLMRRFNIVLNYPRQEVYIKPNEHYTDPFDYSYTGLGFSLINNAITITDVIPDSPAEKAGLQEGDIIIGIETNFSNNIQAYKILLQNVKAKVRVTCMRNGQTKVIELKVKSIL